MKKILVLLLTVSMIAAIFMGCADKPEKLPSDGFGLTSEDTNGNWLRDDVELEILKYRFSAKLNLEKHGLQYYGKYNDMMVLKLYVNPDKGESVIENFKSVTIAGFEFSFTGHIYSVWVDNKLFDLDDAYELGVLTADDIKYIHQRYVSGHHFYGYYNGAIVAQVWEPKGSPDTIKVETIAGFEFQFTDRMKIEVIYNNDDYDIKEAYEKGILTDADIEAFYADYSEARYFEESEE